MKKLLLPLAACAALAGCVGYGDVGYSYGGYGYPGYYSSYPGYYGGYYSGAPVIGGTIVYRDNDYYRGGRGTRDRDRDGVPNRLDRDRDGDGVRNRDDARPNNPRRQ